MPNNKKENFNSGFTLIELLITIAIIAILTAISAFALSGARESARDARRKTDLEQIRTSLEIYKADCNTYPAALPAVSSALTATCGGGTNTYMQKTPGDPATGGSYSYTRPTTISYTLCSQLEDPPNPANDTTGCASCSGGSCGYKVTNP